MNGFERRKEQKKENILKAALELFAAHGFKKVSINDVASRADVSPVTIYNHFGSKDGLVKQAIVMQATRMLDQYRNVIRGEGTFAEKLETIVFNKVDIAAQFQGELGSMILQDSSESSQYVTGVILKDAMEITMELFAEGRREGFLSADISDQAIAAYLEILRVGIAGSKMLTLNKENYPKLVAELNQLFLYGLIDTGDRKEFLRTGRS